MNDNTDNLTPICKIACDPDCIFKQSVVKLEKEYKTLYFLYFLTIPLALWKFVDILWHILK